MSIIHLSMTRKKRVLFVNGHLQVGGVEKALVELLSIVDYNNYDVDLLLLEGCGDYLPEVPPDVYICQRDIRQVEGPFLSVFWRNLVHGRIDNIIYRTLLLISKYFGEKLLFFLRWLLPIHNRYDVAIAFRTGHSSQIVAFAVKADIKFLWWHHGAVPESEGQIEYISRLASKFNSVITVSTGCKILLEQVFQFSPDIIQVIPNIINTEKINRLAQQYDPIIPSGVLKVITISRFSSEKHLEDAVEAAALLLGKLDFMWFIIGDGCEYDHITELIRLKGLEDVVILPGRLANPYPYIKNADMMVHPSHVESLCIAVLEAMSLEVPCVTVRSIGPESFIENGFNGILVEKGPEAIVEGILQLANASQFFIDSLTKNGSLTVEKYFSPSVVWKSFKGLIDN